MQKIDDRSYGIIPVRQQGKEWEFLIVKHLGGHWAFPKGHPEDRETPRQAAIRELGEETGLSVKHFFRRYPFSEQYRFFHAGQRIRKTVIYYLAEVEGELKPQQEELLDARWLDFEACCDCLTYPRSVQICQQSYEFLTSKKALPHSSLVPPGLWMSSSPQRSSAQGSQPSSSCDLGCQPPAADRNP